MLVARRSCLYDGALGAEEGLYCISHKLMVVISDNFLGGKTHVSDQSLESRKDIILEGFDGVYIFLSGGSINDKECIFYTIQASVAAIANINMHDISEFLWSWDWSSWYS